MTLNLSEMKDEPLGKHPIQEAVWCAGNGCSRTTPDQTEQQVAAAADGEGVFKIDVDGLSDEVLDPGYTVSVAPCSSTAGCGGACSQPQDTGGRDGA